MGGVHLAHLRCWAKNMKASDIAEPKTLVLSGLLTLIPLVVGSVLAHYTDKQGLLQLHKDTVFQILGGIGTVMFGLALLLFAALKKIRKKEMVSWAKSQGRPICECTDTGEIMRVTPESASKIGLVVYKCPNPSCRSFLHSLPRH